MVYMDCIQVVAYESLFFCFQGMKIPLEARDHIWMTRDGVQKTKLRHYHEDKDG